MTHHRKHSALPQSPAVAPMTATQTAVASGDKSQNAQLVFAEEIRLCAYWKWEVAGNPIGAGIQFWLEAEQELMKKK